MNEIIPGIIPQNLNLLREQFEKIVGVAPKVQIDILDGEYAPTKSWPFNGDQPDDLVKMVRGEEKFPYIDDVILEMDMLVHHPIEYLPDFISIGAKSFIVHIDSTDHVRECLDTIKGSDGCESGLGIKPSGDINLLESFISSADFVQFMGNDRVGYNGVELDRAVLQKIKSFHDRHPSIPIQIDIGVEKNTIPMLKEAGVTRFISSSTIFNSPDPKATLLELRQV